MDSVFERLPVAPSNRVWIIGFKRMSYQPRAQGSQNLPKLRTGSTISCSSGSALRNIPLRQQASSQRFLHYTVLNEAQRA